MARKTASKLRALHRGQRETYERVQTNLNDNLKEPGKEADFVATLMNRIVVVMIVGALLSLWLSSST
jgi:hypothetical protein